MGAKKKRIAILGCGTIGSFVLESIMDGKVENGEVGIVCLKTEKSKGKDVINKYGVKWSTNPNDIFDLDIDVVVETASHEALKTWGVKMLESGISFIPLSLGALLDSSFLQDLKDAAEKGNSKFYLPSGGIGALDALQAAIIAGVEKVTMTSRKMPAAWTNIPYVDNLGIDLDNVLEPILLFEGPASECVREFPKNINIAAALSLAGIGFEKTIIKMVADPTIKLNIHEIKCEGKAGKFTMKLENEPVPTYPRTTYMACLSAVAALNRYDSHYHIGT